MSRSRQLPLAPMIALLMLAGLAFAGTVSAGEDEEPNIRFMHPMHFGKVCEGQSVADCLTGNRGGYLGVQLVDLTEELRAHFGVDSGTGSMISKVTEDSPAAQAGLQAGDIITLLDGQAMGSSREIARHIRGREEGEDVRIEYQRDGRVESTHVEIAKREGLSEGAFPFFLDLQDLGHSKAMALDSEELAKALEGLDGKTLEQALESAGKAIEGMDWSQHVKRFESLDFGSLEERMEKLQERMKELEKRLEEEYN